jgi:hypothetical protein
LPADSLNESLHTSEGQFPGFFVGDFDKVSIPAQFSSEYEFKIHSFPVSGFAAVSLHLTFVVPRGSSSAGVRKLVSPKSPSVVRFPTTQTRPSCRGISPRLSSFVSDFVSHGDC